MVEPEMELSTEELNHILQARRDKLSALQDRRQVRIPSLLRSTMPLIIAVIYLITMMSWKVRK